MIASYNYSSYLWQDGSTLSSFLVSVPGTYWVQIKNILGCVGRDTVVVSYSNLSTSYTTQPSDCYIATGAAQIFVSGATVDDIVIVTSISASEIRVSASNIVSS